MSVGEEVVDEDVRSYEDDFSAPAQSVDEEVDDYDDDDFLKADESLDSPLGDAAIQLVQESEPQTTTRPSSAGPSRPWSAPRQPKKNTVDDDDATDRRRVDALFAKVEILENRLEEVSKTSTRIRRDSVVDAPVDAEKKDAVRQRRRRHRPKSSSSSPSRRAWGSSSTESKGPAVGSALRHVRAASANRISGRSEGVFIIGASKGKSYRRRRSTSSFTYDPDTGHRLTKTEYERKLEAKKRKTNERAEEPVRKEEVRQQPIGYPTSNIAQAARAYAGRCQTWKSFEQQTRYARQIFLGNFKGAAELEPRPPPTDENRTAGLLSSVVPQHRREHRKLREWDVLVTVEARPNVGKQMSTRHDPNRYTSAANTAASAAIAALSRFRVRAASMVEVSRENDRATASRVGALEVQLAICTADGDIPRLVMIHSKLTTRTWPTEGTIKRATHRAMMEVGAWETQDDSDEKSVPRHDDICVDWTWVFDQRPLPRMKPRQVDIEKLSKKTITETARKPRPSSAQPSNPARDTPVVRLPRPGSAQPSRNECNAFVSMERKNDNLDSIESAVKDEEGASISKNDDEREAPSAVGVGQTGDIAPGNESLEEITSAQGEAAYEDDFVTQNADDEADVSYNDDFEAQDGDDAAGSPAVLPGTASSDVVGNEDAAALRVDVSAEAIEVLRNDELSPDALESPESPQNLEVKYRDEIESASRKINAAKLKQAEDGAEITEWFEQHHYGFLLQYVEALVEGGWGTLDAFEQLTENDFVVAIKNIKPGHAKALSRIAKRMREVTSETTEFEKNSTTKTPENKEEDVEAFREAIRSRGDAEFLRGYAEKSASFLSVKSMKKMLKDLGFRAEDDDAINSLLVHVDFDGDGMIRVEDVSAFASRENNRLGVVWRDLREVVENAGDKYDVVRLDQQLFKKYDKNMSGQIPVSKFNRAVAKLCSRSTAKKNVEDVGELSIWGDRVVDYVMFTSWLNPVDILKLRRTLSRWLPKQLAANEMTEDALFDSFLNVHGGQLQGALTQSELAIAIRATGLDISDADARALRIHYSSSSSIGSVQDSFDMTAWSSLVEDAGRLSKKRKKSSVAEKRPPTTTTKVMQSSSSLASLADLPKM